MCCRSFNLTGNTLSIMKNILHDTNLTKWQRNILLDSSIKNIQHDFIVILAGLASRCYIWPKVNPWFGRYSFEFRVVHLDWFKIMSRDLCHVILHMGGEAMSSYVSEEYLCISKCNENRLEFEVGSPSSHSEPLTITLHCEGLKKGWCLIICVRLYNFRSSGCFACIYFTFPHFFCI